MVKRPCLVLTACLLAFSTLWELVPWELIFLVWILWELVPWDLPFLILTLSTSYAQLSFWLRIWILFSFLDAWSCRSLGTFEKDSRCREFFRTAALPVFESTLGFVFSLQTCTGMCFLSVPACEPRVQAFSQLTASGDVGPNEVSMHRDGQHHMPCLGVFCFASSCCSSRVQYSYTFVYYLPSSRGCFGCSLVSHTLLYVHLWTTSPNAWSINLTNDVWKVLK